MSLLHVLAFQPRPPGTGLQVNKSIAPSREGAAHVKWGITRCPSKKCREGLVGTRLAFGALEEGLRKQDLALDCHPRNGGNSKMN